MESATKLIGALKKARRLINSDLTVQQLLVFALVVDAGAAGVEQGSLVLNHGMSRTNLSKIVQDLSVMTSRKEAGPGLIESRMDPFDLRIRILVPTPKGRDVMQQILG